MVPIPEGVETTPEEPEDDEEEPWTDIRGSGGYETASGTGTGAGKGMGVRVRIGKFDNLRG